MRKVKTNRRNRIFGLFAMFAMAIGVGVALAPREVIKTQAASTYTWTAASGDQNKLGNANGTATLGSPSVGWAYTRANASYEQWSSPAVQLGSKNQPAGTTTMKATMPATIGDEIKSVKVGTMGYSDGWRLEIKVGGVSRVSNQTVSTNPTLGYITTGNLPSGTKGEIELIWTSGQRALYIASIEVVGADGAVEYDPATSVSVSAAGGASTVGIGKKLQLSAVVNPNPGANQEVTWDVTSGNDKASVDEDGLVTGLAAGSATITATSTTPGVSGSINLTVVDPYAGFDGVETFESQTALTSTYADGSFVGESGVTFVYKHSRNEGLGTADDSSINGKGLMLRYAGTSYLEFVLPDGLSHIEFEYRKAFTGASARQLELYVNGELAKLSTNIFGSSSGAETTVYTFKYTPDEGIPGPATIKIKNTGDTNTNKQITIDNIVWMDGPELQEAVLQSISLNTTAVKKVFYVGEKFTSAGLVVTATDSANPPFLVEDYDILPEEGHKFVVGDIDDHLEVIVEVTIGGVTKDASYYVEVRAARTFNAANVVHFGRIYSFGATHTVGEETVTIAMSTGVTSNQPQSVPVDLASGSYTEIADMLTVKLLPGSKTGTYALEAQEGSNAGKFLRAQVTYKDGEEPTAATDIRFAADINDESSWTINFEEGKLRVRNYVVPGRFISGNPSTNRFALLTSLQGGSEPYLYEDNSSVNALVEATVFVDAVNDGIGEGAEGACHEAFGYLEFIFDQLSEDAFDVLVDSEDQDFLDAIERYQYLEAWTAANPEPGAPGSVISPNNENAPLNATLIIGLLGLTTMAGYYFLSKKEKLVK